MTGLGAADPVAWRIAGCLAPRLPRLDALIVLDCYDTFGLLRTIPFVGLGPRLQQLRLTDYGARLGTIMLCPALHQMTALTSLYLACADLQLSDAAELRSACGQLRSLRSVTVSTRVALAEPLLAVFPGSLSGLTQLCLSVIPFRPAGHPDLEQQPTQLAAAVSGLLGLEELWTNYALEAATAVESAQAASQLAVLGHLTGLTRLELWWRSPSNATLALPMQLQRLQRLWAGQRALAQLPLEHPALEVLEVLGFVAIPSSWRGRVAQGCRLHTLYFNAKENVGFSDLQFQNLPTLPRLRHLRIGEVQPSPGHCRFIHLADVLRRHAATLEAIELRCASAWEEPFPRELPECKQLRLLNMAVSWHTLQLLRCCSLPRLEDLLLRLPDDVSVEALAATAEVDLGWLQGLQHLKSVGISVSGRNHEALKAALEQILPEGARLSFS